MITEEVTELGPGRPFKVLGKTFLIQEGELKGTIRCPDVPCTNQPTTMALSFAISGSVTTSAECNDEELYPIDISGDTGTVDVTYQDAFGCDQYSIGTVDVLVEYTCSNPACSGSFNTRGRAILNCGGGDWTLNISLEDLGSICSDFPFGGTDLLIVNLGPNPIGTHNFSFDDPNISSVHYEITLVIT